MSKAAKQSIIILIVLLLASFGFAAITYTDKQKLETIKISLEKKVQEHQSREKQYLLDNKALSEKLAEAEKRKISIEERLSRVDEDMDALNSNISELKSQRDDWKKRAEKNLKEKDELARKIKQRPKPEIIYKYIEPEQPDIAQTTPPSRPQYTQKSTLSIPDAADDAYWAQVLKEKASIELELENLKGSLSNNALEVVELKKENSDLQLALSELESDKETIEREIKRTNDLADTLSLQLARSKNDNKFLNDRINRMKGESINLRDQIKRLTSTKIALEKSIVRMQDEKKEIEKKLVETESVIQSRIDEIWQIKDSIDKEFTPLETSRGSDIELPPIVVSARSSDAEPVVSPPQRKVHGFDGNVVSINQENNFVIVDIGEASGVRLGDNLSVYRGAEYVAALEVIQVRKDIAAADIKNKVAKIRIGDIVK